MDIKIEKTKDKKIGGGSITPYTPENMRGKLAEHLLWLFSIIIGVSVVYALSGNMSSESADLIKYLISGLIGMLGTVIGFYYGQNIK